MTCTSCGQANPNHLVFCQTCGQRLAPRIAPPTPPVGLPMPSYNASPHDAPPPAPGWPAPPANLEAVPSPKPACPACGSPNQPGMRFCLTCGQRLSTSVAPPPPAPVPLANNASPYGPPPVAAPGNNASPYGPPPAQASPPQAAQAPFPNAAYGPPPALPSPAFPAPTHPHAQAVTAAMPEVPPMRPRAPSVPPPAPPKRPSIPAPAEVPTAHKTAPPPAPPRPASVAGGAPANRFHTVLGNPEPPPPGPDVLAAVPPAPVVPVAPAPIAPTPFAGSPTAPTPFASGNNAGMAGLGGAGGTNRMPPMADAPTFPIAEPPTELREPPTARVCGRCHGTSDTQAQFCRFCGASMNEAFAPGAEVPTAEVATPVAAAPVAAAPTPLAPAVAAIAPVFVGPAAPAVPAAQPKQAFGRLIVVAKDGGEGPNYPLHERVDIGRSEGEVRFPDDRYLSPRHVRISVRDGRVYLRDLQTPNGVYLRLREAPVTLANQGVFLIGQQVLRLEILQPDGFGPVTEGDTLLFGTPTSPRYARLCQRTVEGVTLDVFHIRKAETVLGRESGDIVFADDPFLSRRHATLHYDVEKKTVQLRDLGSSNGTFHRATGDEIEVASGDQFRIGQQLFRIELGEGARKG